jgi:RNA polymerase sigma-70 factor (family 1)
MITSDHNDLINGFHNGNEISIRQLYDLHYRPLCYFADKLINDKQEAEDIAVDTFLKLLRKKADFNSLSDIKSFLFTAARNACFDFLRKNKTKNRSFQELSYLSTPQEQFGEEEMIISSVLQVIYSEVENLPNQCRAVFKSIFIEGKTTAAVAAEMRISTQTVLNQKSKALQTIRQKLYKTGFYSVSVFMYYLFFIAASTS